MLYVDHVQQLVVHLETVALHHHSYVTDLLLLLPVYAVAMVVWYTQFDICELTLSHGYCHVNAARQCVAQCTLMYLL
jgi:hypothetical protein